MVREDLVEGAITFLQDPSVAGAPLEQRIAFLRSKNLTQEEIDASLARVGQAAAPPNSQPPSIQYRQPPPQYNNGYSQQQYGYPPNWQQPPPEAPRRDWRDYFIAATVIGGVGYGLYWTAKRYVYPLIAPPTPPQLEQDKANVDASFDKAFALLEQLATDTKELKDAEAQRKERLDNALGEVESVISRMKQANDERELEAKRIAREINEIRDQIPKAIEKERELSDSRLKDLNVEMKSLKTLVANRMQGGGAAPGSGRATPSFANQQQQQSTVTATQGANGPANGNSTPQSTPAAVHEVNGIHPQSTNGTETNGTNGSATSTERSNSMPFSSAQNRDGAGTPYSRLLGGKAAIPSWQLAAKKKNDEAKADGASSGTATPVQNVSESGTVTEVDGQA